ncbi:MAG TPA: hypothetical protein PLA20_05160 [Bacilli bacterium]|jgi:hypothetical protein|nr:MAG: hypothetical protein BWX94_01293 [Tenericutes bacterium ADurb.Bin140]HON64678.1 hypothetical protein [Bacilli bacterium]HOR96236.1 hypothetical protein [Bacilli bacterium]HPD12828.1 hypothetical protein [Bacilli bacterium]HPK58616.1 hypothetical protein [Bacilli bacterium]
MEWKDLFPEHKQPTMAEISEYIGGSSKELWVFLIRGMEIT